MQYVSFSLFGSNPQYTVGALKNAQLMPSIYPGWKMVCYVDDTVPKAVLKELEALKVDVRKGDAEIQNEMFWRFLIADDPKMTRFIIRDSDSRIGPRERAAVDEWIQSGLPFHSMRDHPHHTLPLGGGLWGAVKGAVKNIKSLIVQSKLATRQYTRETGYGLDQTFLTRYVWPQAKGNCLQHDSCTRHLYPDSKPFPSGCAFKDWRFVGEIFSPDDKPNPHHFQMRINHMEAA